MLPAEIDQIFCENLKFLGSLAPKSKCFVCNDQESIQKGDATALALRMNEQTSSRRKYNLLKICLSHIYPALTRKRSKRCNKLA